MRTGGRIWLSRSDLSVYENNSTSERKILENVPNIRIVDGLECEKFSFQMTEEEKKERKEFMKISSAC